MENVDDLLKKVAVDPTTIDECLSDARKWAYDIEEEIECNPTDIGNIEELEKADQDSLTEWVSEAAMIMKRQSEIIEKLRASSELYKSELVKSQFKIINVQSNLLASKLQKIDDVKSAVLETVESGMNDCVKSVQKEVTSYSEAVSASVTTKTVADVSAITEESVKRVVQEVKDDEKRSRSVMLFGVKEKDNESVEKSVGDILSSLNEKPRVEAIRLGVKREGVTRPIRVIVRSTSIAHQILSKARKLKDNRLYESVFISPDRSESERVAHRKLVAELKHKRAQKPAGIFYIRRGEVIEGQVDQCVD